MPKTRIPSPARSQGDVPTPKRKKTRGSRSLCSPALSTASGRLTSLIDQFKDKNRQSFALSPLNSRSVLNDNTDIEEPRRKSWWKKLDENSQAVMDVLEDNKVTDANNLIEDIIDIEVLSQEKKNFTLDLPESSDNESINSIVLPQRKLFTQKENQPQKKFGQLIGNRETLGKLHKTNTANIDKTVNTGARELFQNTKRSKPIFPAALLQISPNKTAVNKTKENLVVDPKPPVRNIFGNRPNNKRKNIFAEFIVSESEDEIPDIQPKVFGFQKKLEQRRISSASRVRDASPTSSITTDIEMDDWRHLPSSTLVENQLEDMVAGNTPIKRARLSKLSEAKESEAGTVTIQTNTTGDKTKQSNKSTSSKNKSKSSPELKEKLLNNSRITRSMVKNTSVREELHNTSKKQVAKGNLSQNRNISKDVSNVSTSNPKDMTDKQTTLNKSNNLNKTKTRNNTKATDNECESDDNGIKINDETKILSKSSSKNKSINTEKIVSEEDIKMDAKNVTGNNKVQDKSKDTSLENIEQDNQEDDDEHNFTLQYEDDIVRHEEVVQSDQHKTQKNYMKIQKSIVLEKDAQNEINNSMKKKSPTQQKQSKVVEESVESQQNEINAADDNVDGIQENGHEAEIKNQESTYEESVAKVDEYELSKNREDPNESEANQVNEGNNDDAILSQTIEDEHNESPAKVTNESDADKANITDADENEAIASGEIVEDEANASNVEENKSETNESCANEDLGNESEEDEDKANESEEDEDKANESEEDEDKANESDEEEASVYEEANESQEIEAKTNESQEAEVNQSQEIEEEANESHVEDHDGSDEENQDEEEEIEEETANETQEHDMSANVSHEGESENNLNESDEVEHDQQMDDSDEADKAIASDAETSDHDNDVEMEVDEDDEEEVDEDDEEEVHEDVDESGQEVVEQNEIEPSDEVIEESPNATHDTTGRNRKKELIKSPEVIRNNRIAQMDSFTAKGRNTSLRKTKSIKDLNIRPSLAPPRDSIGFSDGTTNSSAEGSGWDSHRTTRKTLRQTFGKDFTPRKSLRALVMEKSAKRHTEHMDMQSETVKFPQANSTEFPDSIRDVEDTVESDHELSRRTRQTTLEMYLQKIKQQNIEKKLKMEETVRNSLKGTVKDTLSLFKVPNKPAPRRPKPTQNKQKKQITSIIPFDELPSEVIKDMKYKPPKRFQPTNASWITKRLYKFLENKLEAKYDYKARVRAEKLVETIYHFAKDLRRHDVAPIDAVEVLKDELARLEVVRTHFEFYEFFHEFMPREVRVKVVPDIVNKIALPRHGVFSDILREVQGF